MVNKNKGDIRQSVYTILNNLSKVDTMFINVPSKWMHPKNGIFSLPNIHLDIASHNSDFLLGDQDYEPNHGLLLVISYLRSMNIDVDLFDMHTLYYLVSNEIININVEEKLYYMLEIKAPKVIGLSCMTPTLPLAKKISNNIRKILPQSKIILGGIASVDVDDCFADSSFDIVVRGEGEYVVYQLIYKIIHDCDYFDLPNISFIRKGKICNNEIACIKGQANVPPAYDLLPRELELIPRIYTSRGCANQCDFCSPSKFFGNKCIIRPTTEVIEEIIHIHKNYNFDMFLIGDLTLYMNNNSFNEICQFLINGNYKKWWCQTQVNQLNEYSISLLKNAKCYEVAVGFEDMSIGNEKIRKKNPDKLHAKRICNLLKKSGIKIQGYWLFGTEDENFESSIAKIEDICEFIREDLMDTVHISFFIPYPNVITSGYFMESFEYNKYIDLKSSFYDELPLYHTKYLTNKEIYLLSQLAISSCANEYYKKRIK